MNRVVINSDFGGFDLSHEGVIRYAELKGIVVHAYVTSLDSHCYNMVPYTGGGGVFNLLSHGVSR